MENLLNTTKCTQETYLLEVFLGNPLGPNLTKLLRPASIGYVCTLEENPLHQQMSLTVHRGQVVVGSLTGNTGFLRLKERGEGGRGGQKWLVVHIHVGLVQTFWCM